MLFGRATVHSALFTVILVIAANAAMAASGQGKASEPSWFPDISCDRAWHGEALDKYDFATDSQVLVGFGNRGYASYEKRLAQKLPVPRSSCYKDWTVLVYMAADKELEPYALWDLDEMEAAFDDGSYAASTLKSDLIVQHDSVSSSSARRLHMFQTPGPYVPVVNKSVYDTSEVSRVRSPIIETIEKVSKSGTVDHQKRLKEFLQWGMTKYPAKHYFVIIWGHGQGWAQDRRENAPTESSRFSSSESSPINFSDWGTKPKDSLNASLSESNHFGGFVFSQATNEYLGIPSLSRVLRDVKAETLEDRKDIDMYASDACLMQMVEVAYELSNSVRFIAGSAQVHSYLGLPYRELLREINTGEFSGQKKEMRSDDEPYLIARMISKLQAKSLDPISGSQGQAEPKAIETYTFAALSATDLRSRLVPKIRTLGAALEKYLREDPIRGTDLNDIISNTPSFLGGSRDLGSFVGLIKLHVKKESLAAGGEMNSAAAQLLNAAEAVKDALQMVSLDYSYGTTYRADQKPLHILGFRALAIWLPATQIEFQTRLPDFKQSRFFADEEAPTGPQWNNWLNLLYKIRK